MSSSNKKNRKYWQNRFMAIEEQKHESAEKAIADLEYIYKKAQREIESQIAVWYRRFAQNNEIDLAESRRLLNTWELSEFNWDVNQYIKHGKENAISQQWAKELENASARFHINRLEALKFQTQNTIEQLFGNQLDIIDSLMKKQYLDGYYHSIYEIQKGFNIGWDIASVNDKQLNAIMKKPWTKDNKTFSDRVWTHKNKLLHNVHTELTQNMALSQKDKLLNNVHTELTRNMILGKAPDDSIRNLAKAMNTTKYNAGRLIMTESAYFSSLSQKDAFNELDVEKFKVVATLDSHTSAICQGMDGEVAPMEKYEPGVTAPPFHPWCRSTTIPYFDDNFGERVARDSDGKIYYVPSDMKYPEWKEKYVDGNLSNSNNSKDSSNSKDIEKHDKKSLLEQKLALARQEIEQERNKQVIEQEKIEPNLTKIENSIIIEDNPFSRERKDNALWAKSPQEADEALREVCGNVWRNASESERKAIYEYTFDSERFNRPLRGYEDSWYNFVGVGKVPFDQEGKGAEIEHMTNLINKSTYDSDIWLQRGITDERGVAAFLQIEVDDLLGSSEEDLKNLLINKTIPDDAFFSCGSAKGMGFDGYIFNIYCPKGTKMMYSEPFSYYGNGDSLAWDGVSKQSSFGTEDETIIQRGTKFTITKLEKSTNGNMYFDIEVESQI